jgi:hypothetical protein
VVISTDGRRAYVNNEAKVSVTAMDLVTNTVLTRDIAAGEPPAPGTFSHDTNVDDRRPLHHLPVAEEVREERPLAFA